MSYRVVPLSIEDLRREAEEDGVAGSLYNLDRNLTVMLAGLTKMKTASETCHNASVVAAEDMKSADDRDLMESTWDTLAEIREHLMAIDQLFTGLKRKEVGQLLKRACNED